LLPVEHRRFRTAAFPEAVNRRDAQKEHLHHDDGSDDADSQRRLSRCLQGVRIHNVGFSRGRAGRLGFSIAVRRGPSPSFGDGQTIDNLDLTIRL